MNNYKKYLLVGLTVVLSAMSMYGRQAGEMVFKRLALHLVSGETVRFELDANPMMTFNDESLVLVTDETQILYALNQVSKFTYEGEEESALPSVEETSILVHQDRELLSIEGLSEGTPVGIYTLEGQRVIMTRALGSEPTQVSLGTLPEGIYIIQAGSLSYKFVKQ